MSSNNGLNFIECQKLGGKMIRMHRDNDETLRVIIGKTVLLLYYIVCGDHSNSSILCIACPY